MIYDKERIATIIKDIEKFFIDLDESDIKGIKDLEKNRVKFYSASMVIFSLVNRAVDLGDEIVASRKLGIPTKYREIFSLLSRNKIIDENLEKAFSKLIHFRNLIAHEYQEFTEKEIYEALKEIRVIKKFVEIVKKEIKQNKNKKFKKTL